MTHHLARQHYDREDRRAVRVGVIKLIAICAGALVVLFAGFVPW